LVIEWEAAERPVAARVRNLLSSGERTALLRAAIDEERWFVEASTGGADDHRRAHVHYTTVDEALAVVDRVAAVAPEAARGLGLSLPSIARIEKQLTVHLDGDYYRRHTDNQGEEAARRVLTYVYFFHGQKRWRGGELVLHCPDRHPIEPLDNSLVLFNAGLEHEVTPVIADAPLSFAEGRFTINGWLCRP
jgi:Rps23 Pro-64 3,4-dihydroxylase Tpa1-like proline 4-hydroxylase